MIYFSQNLLWITSFIRCEKQLFEYLDYYKADTGYMLSFNFNKNKKIGIKEVVLNEKQIYEVVV